MESKVLTIAKAVCNYYGMDLIQICQNTNKREIVRKRQIIYYFCKKYKVSTDVLTGRLIGNKDHATVFHGYKTISSIMEIQDEKNTYQDVHYMESIIKRIIDSSYDSEKRIRYNKSRSLVGCRSAAKRHKISMNVEFIC